MRPEKRGGPSLGNRTRRAAEWILARQEADGGWGGIQPPWVYSILALHLLGYPMEHPAMAAAVERYTFWREKRKAGDLLLGSKASAGGQLPLLMMRTQRVVDLLAANQLLDAGVIGIRPGDPPKWKIFYDPDDALGFPTRRLFREQAAIQEFEVETGWFPVRAHTEYWRNRRVQREIAQLIVQNLE